MSEFFIYAFANFSWYGNPTPKNILGVHWDMTVPGEIQKFLAVNTTENSTTLWNYRQRECAFWMEYLPSVIGMHLIMVSAVFKAEIGQLPRDVRIRILFIVAVDNLLFSKI